MVFDTDRASVWFAVTILTLLYAMAKIDRQIVVILATPIKADLVLSDVRIGPTQGAIAIFFTGASLQPRKIAKTSVPAK